MEYENSINSIPQNIIETILSLLPLRDAVRTSVLSQKWRYGWRGMPKLTFTNNMVMLPMRSSSGCTLARCKLTLARCKLVKAIFHVLLFHKGPQIVEFDLCVGLLDMKSEFAQMISYLAMKSCVKELSFSDDKDSCKLPLSFFSLQGLECMFLSNCHFEPPLTFNGFGQLKRMEFCNVVVTSQALERFLSKCPLLDGFSLLGGQENDFAAEGNTFTFVDLLLYVPLIKSFAISKYYMKYLCAGASPHTLPNSLVHLECVVLDVCVTEQSMISFTFCMLRSSPVLKKIAFRMHDNKKLPVEQTPAHFLDSENHPDLKLDHLETLDIRLFSGLPLEMEFVKLIMAKSPKLEKVQIELNSKVSVDEELEILRAMLLLPSSLRASASARLSVLRPKTC